jgi:acylphosphatase
MWNGSCAMKRTVHVRIAGRVQGVGYRAWTEWEASELGLEGWVRNRRDGTVEAVFSGGAEAVTEMLRRCESGPPGARVTGIDIVGEDAGSFHGFVVRPTA